MMFFSNRHAFVAILTIFSPCNARCDQGKKYTGAPGDIALENAKRAPENRHRLQCKSFSAMWKVAPENKKNFPLVCDIPPSQAVKLGCDGGEWTLKVVMARQSLYLGLVSRSLISARSRCEKPGSIEVPPMKTRLSAIGLRISIGHCLLEKRDMFTATITGMWYSLGNSSTTNKQVPQKYLCILQNVSVMEKVYMVLIIHVAGWKNVKKKKLTFRPLAIIKAITIVFITQKKKNYLLQMPLRILQSFSNKKIMWKVSTPNSIKCMLILTLSRPLSHLCDGRSHSFRDHGRIFATKTKALLRLP